MLFRQLEYFVAVAREKHFARAADACYVSQPALSVAIAKLERELNVTLINRGRSFEGLTPEGERLVVWAKRILAEHDAFKAEVAVMRSGITGTLRLGTGPTVSTTTALPVAAFCAMHPLARVKVNSRLSSGELIRQLRDFELDAAIAHFGPDDHEGLDVVPLYEEQYTLLAPGEHLTPQRPTITWAEAAQLPLALLSPDMRFRQFIDRAFQSAGVVANPQVETDSVASLYANVASGAWASIVPHTWLNAMPVTGGTRAVRLVGPDARAQISVAIHAATPGSIAARTFLNVVAGLSLDEVFAPQRTDLAALARTAVEGPHDGPLADLCSTG
ncbi:LysR family transcriptional regulator [Streptomyces sp. B-S-A8]|uniref:LysR family transcriptional regulator n=1 Tax=Streptomyces solicavernae TaxID=3043614 RepID=A0ABT6RZ01_9ACTN|nr:LysR family transcriptional regulator [Streptomyces sp. B-S-A8]MDI3389565.1 LysR family transcriptional regulator [Streptomyces sp. B-S-A8]